MYLAIDFLITPELKLYLAGVHMGLPGGAHQYHLAHLVQFRKTLGYFQAHRMDLSQSLREDIQGLHSFPSLYRNSKNFQDMDGGRGLLSENLPSRVEARG